MNFNGTEDTLFQMKKVLNCSGRLLDLSTPVVMGILNITPDSFYDGGKLENDKSVLKAVEKMVINGATIIDIGGQSTRPKSKILPAEEEWNRIGKYTELLCKEFHDTVFSIDTFYSIVASRAVDSGVTIINDVSAGDFDTGMIPFVAGRDIPFIAMHMKGVPSTMQDNPSYENVVKEILEYFVRKVTLLRSVGIKDIIIDPGFGFGKTVDHNFSLLKNLSLFKMLDCPLLCGLSRKSMITQTIGVKPEQALNGTTVLNTIALLNGASILRVHDVQEAIEAIKIFTRYNQTL